MKSQFNSKMSSSPFYVGPSVYVENKSGWSFIKKEKLSYKFMTIGTLLCVAIVIALI